MALPSILPGTPAIYTRTSSCDYCVTQLFGSRPNVYGAGGHNGIDFAPKKAGQTGVKVQMPHEGWISHGWDENGYGNYIQLTSDPFGPKRTRRVSILGHFEKFLTKAGIFISQFDYGGIMGKTGFADGVHTHWTYYLTSENGQKLNYNNGHYGALNIADFIIVDGGKTLSSIVNSKKAKAAAIETHECCSALSPLDILTSVPLPVI